MGHGLEALQPASAEGWRDYPRLRAYTRHCWHEGWGRWMEITYSANSRDNFTVNPTDSYTLQKETDLCHTGQHASCPFFARRYKNCSSLPVPSRVAGSFIQAVQAQCSQLLRSLDQDGGWRRWQCKSFPNWAILCLLWAGFTTQQEPF